MKTSLRENFFIVYFILFLSMLIIANTYGRYYLTTHMEAAEQKKLYNTADTIANQYINNAPIKKKRKNTLKNSFHFLQSMTDMRLLIANNKGKVIVDSEKHPSITGKNLNKQTNAFLDNSSFKGNPSKKLFHEDQLFVIYPLTNNTKTVGYIITMKPLILIKQEATTYIDSIILCFLIFFVLLLLFFLFLDYKTTTPLKDMTYAAQEYAKGHFDYKMNPVKGHDYSDLAGAIRFLAEKMSSMNDYQKKFIANVSHDFRSPLTSIRGYSEAMKDGTIPYEMQGKYLDIILFETGRLEKLTKNLLSLSEFESNGFLIEPSTFDINKIIKQTSATFEQRCIEKHISINLYFQEKHLYAIADVYKIERVIQNLLDNAIKFSPNNSSIEIHTMERLGKIFVSIKDHGIGIPKNCQNKIWSRFYKTDQSRGKDKKGTGLGLSIVKEIIDAHGENINVISTPNVGTEFIFTLKETHPKL